MGIFKKMMYVSAVVAVMAAAVAIYGYRAIYSSNTDISEPRDIYIATGSGYDDVKDQLISKGYIDDITTFDLVARMMKYKRDRVKSGKYVIVPGMSNRALIQRLRAGDQTPVDVTISTGRYVADIAGRISEVIETDSMSILTALTDESYLKAKGFNPETAISMIIPNTYEMYWDVSPEDLRDRMMREYDKYWSANGRDEKLEKLGMSRAEVSTLASIVEKESNLASERPTVAGVYINRLKRSIPLQADPTVVYAVGDFSIRRVLNRHLEYDSPYNTYKYAGLPPGPICLPSRSSIDAVLSYEPHDYLYFCAKPGYDGAHNFAKTITQHNRNARIYHRWLNSEGIMR